MTTVQDILTFLEQIAPPSLAESWDNIGLMTGNRGTEVSRVLCALDVTETTVQDILTFLEQIAPPSLAESWDNIGLMTGNRGTEVSRVLCALDVTEGVVQEAADCGAQLIVAHHPLIFTSVHAVTADDTTGRALMTAIRHGISVICMHTNADCAEGGVNDVLAAALGLTEIVNMEAGENGMLGRVGNLPEAMPPRAFAAYVKERLHAGGVRFTDAGKPVRRVAVGGGACGKMMDSALGKGADAFVIGDCSYDDNCSRYFDIFRADCTAVTGGKLGQHRTDDREPRYRGFTRAVRAGCDRRRCAGGG